MDFINRLKIVGILLGVISVGPTWASGSQLRLGSVAMDTPAAMQERLTPLTNYLSESLGQPVVLKLSPNMASAIDAIANGDVDIAYLTPVAYVRAYEKGKPRLVVKLLTENTGTFQLMIVVRENSAIKQLGDLVGKRFAFGDKAALLQRAIVVEAGIPLDRLGEYRFIGHYDNIVRGVLNGDFEAGILKDTTAQKWVGKGIHILHTSPPLPPYNIAASPKLDDATFQKLKKALLELSDKDSKHIAVLQALDKKYTGFAPTTDADYDVVRKLIKPFATDE